MILVAGGTGTLGTLVVQRLLAEGHEVRVLTRDRQRAGHLAEEVQIVTGDVRDASDVARAVKGCATVVSAVHGFVGPDSPSPESTDRDGNRLLIRAASLAGVMHFVLISVLGASADHPMSLFRAKYAAEEELRTSGLRFTIIQPTAFLETWLMVIGSTLAEKGHALVFGPGRNPINFVSVRDVAALVALSTSDEALWNASAKIGGPENLDFVSVAERLIEASGNPGRIKHIPLPVLRVMSFLARPFSPGFARQAGAAVVMNTMDMTFDASSRSRFPTLPTTTLKDLLEPA